MIYSKILLFGEYTVIHGGAALAAPCKKFGGEWELQFSSANVKQSLLSFGEYLKSEFPNEGFDSERFVSDIEAGYIFRSNIIAGSGLGSSGTLCAGIYERFFEHTLAPNIHNAPALKGVFSRMENYFHGSSSGLDPLVSYLDTPVYIQGDTFKNVELDSLSLRPAGLFLLNSRQKRNTKPLVEEFMKRSQDEAFRQAIAEELAPEVDNAISAISTSHATALREAFRRISGFQYRYFEPMIPESIRPLWQHGLHPDAPYSLKLCGAGGGGYMLGLSDDIDSLGSELDTYKVTPIDFKF